MKSHPLSIIVIGGGAAGFFAAINSAELHPDSEVILLEKTTKLLTKVRVSGGGRCNVTHACFENAQLIKNYPRGEKELRNIFSRFSTSDTIEWFEKRGVKLKTESDGRMFPTTDNSETIANCLLNEAARLAVKIKLGVAIEKINKNEIGGFTLFEKNGGTFTCDKLIIAIGGNSKLASYKWLEDLGHTIVPPVPSLFTFNIPNNSITELMGVAVPFTKIKVQNTKIETEGPLMITHWGLSGPAVLKASAWGARILNDFNYDFTINVNWLPKYTEEKLRIEFSNQKENGGKLLFSNCPFEFPKRLWEHLLKKSQLDSGLRWGDLSKKNTNALIQLLLNDNYHVNGKTTFKEEFVTCGGIHLKEIDFSSLESKIVKNMYFSGEVIDIDGVTGGFNFQNAWSTAWIVANNLKNK